ncbi:MAG: hypothetical protein A2556_02210 [Candidatus Vogelbacteria bacterium RIFOXYD2_FULL_44_9]|uniref:Uncharacterized protein n=1 Tax=Candidatus Vogelbacteria bacterium RIFOXYD2_FULL_44_9 TaxID=1802441 RepID=A0A1G2QK68_9BACT|nr:MAG: hypothetical protein A2556_02210 [Candidatus Vogelbacteria bacterium RIFOXYD2_FULL_44_9]
MKKYILGLVLIATLVVVPIVSSGATIEELLAQIAALQAQIEAMQGSGSDGPATTPITGPTTFGQPEVKVLGSSLMLSGLLGNELSLRANFSVKVTAKDGDIYFQKVRPFWLEFNSPTLPPKNGGMPSSCSWIETPTLKMDTVRELNGNDFYVLPKGKTTNFNLSVSCKTSEMFAGSYTGRLAGFSFANTNPTTWVVNTWPTTYVVINSLTNRAITVIGEKGPWISDVNYISDKNKVFIIGERLSRVTSAVVGSKNFALDEKKTDKQVLFTLGTVALGNYPMYLESPLGKSNTVRLQIEDLDDPVNQLPIIYSITSSVAPGGRVEIQGERLTRTDYGRLVVVKGSSYDPYPIISSPDGKKLSFQVDSRETPGTYDVYVQTPAGVSNSVSLNVVGPEGSPKITSATANVRADNNSTVDVTIRGEKFADIGNIVKIGTLTRTAGIAQIGSEFLLSVSIPRSQMPNGAYPVTVEVSGKGVSNVVTLQVGSVATQPSVTVISPNGGERYQAGGTMNISWRGGFAHVGLGVVDSNGAVIAGPNGIGTLGMISAWEPNTGSYVWQIPTDFTPSSSYRLSVSSYNSETALSIQDRSDNYFTIVAPPVTPTNLLQNGDFSAGQANWDFLKVVINVLRNFDGAYNTSNSGEILYQTVLTKPGSTYEYGAKVKSNLTSGVCQVDVFGSGVDTDVINSYGVQNRSWSDTFVAKGASVQIRMINTAIVPATTGSVACSYDDLYLKPVTTVAKATTINQLASALASLKALIQALR